MLRAGERRSVGNKREGILAILVAFRLQNHELFDRQTFVGRIADALTYALNPSSLGCRIASHNDYHSESSEKSVRSSNEFSIVVNGFT